MEKGGRIRGQEIGGGEKEGRDERRDE